MCRGCVGCVNPPGTAEGTLHSGSVKGKFSPLKQTAARPSPRVSPGSRLA